MELRLHADRAGFHEHTPWVSLDRSRNPVQSGHGLDTAPVVGAVLIIVPDDCLYVLTISVPDLPKKRLILALPGLFEEQILVPPESVGFTLLGLPSVGMATVAIYNQVWFDSLMAAPPVANCSAVRVVAESWALPRVPGQWSLHFATDRFVLGLPHWASCVGSNAADGDVPQHLAIALRKEAAEVPAEGASPRELAIYCSAELGDNLPAWLGKLELPVKQGGVLDWLTASYDAAPSLSYHQRLTVPTAEIGQALRPALLLAILLCLFEFCFAATDWVILSLERKKLLTQQETIFRATLGPQAPLVNAENQVLTKLASAQVLSGHSAASDMLTLMTRVAEQGGMPPALDELRYESGQLLLKPKGPDDEAAWMALARSAGLAVTLDQREGKRSIRIMR